MRVYFITFFVLAAMAYLAPDALMFLAVHRWKLSPDELGFSDVQQYHVVVIAAAFTIYGCARFLTRFPAPVLRTPDQVISYPNWLRTTTWTSRLPLPLGPVYLTAMDFVVLAIGCALSKYHAHYFWGEPFAAFLGGIFAGCSHNFGGQRQFSCIYHICRFERIA